MNSVKVYILLLVLLIASCAPGPLADRAAKEAVQPDLYGYFQGFDGTFVLYDLQNDRYTRYNPEQSAERFLPASTFKIMNALVALETGIVPDENYVISWDGTQYENPEWNQDHTLKTAFQNSVVWYYVEVAGRVGEEKIQQYMDAVGYGNQNINGVSDAFWLDGSLTISADEQVEFLKRLYTGDLPFSPRSMEIVREIMLRETPDGCQLRGKTGSGSVEGEYVGWFVGYEEVNGNVYFFAANITGQTPEVNGPKAREISAKLLQVLIQ